MIDGGFEVAASQLYCQEGEESVHHTWQVAVVLVCVGHGVECQPLHGKVEQTAVEHLHKPEQRM